MVERNLLKKNNNFYVTQANSVTTLVIVDDINLSN